nr:MAG TPA: Effector protein [Caudoviricetes sp.]
MNSAENRCWPYSVEPLVLFSFAHEVLHAVHRSVREALSAFRTEPAYAAPNTTYTGSARLSCGGSW